MGNPEDITHKGHKISGSARKENSTYAHKWKPNAPVVDGSTYVFEPEFQNKLWSTEEQKNKRCNSQLNMENGSSTIRPR
jgi:hypothetical protein